MIKLTKKFVALLLLLVVSIACSSDDSVNTPLVPSVDDVNYEIVSAEDFTAEEIVGKIFADGSFGVGVDAASISKMFLEALNNRTAQLESELGVKGIQLGYRRVKYLYNSVDHEGNPVTLSSVVYWNRYKLDGWHDVTPDNICLVEHYTITSDAEAPSNSFPVEAHITGNSIVVMPDYLGYGYTSNRLHPYLNYELAAENSMDALKAAYAICRDHSQMLVDGSWNLCVLGASQGGSNALAVHKYLDTNPALSAQWRFSHSCCAAGAYSLAATFYAYLYWGLLDYPVVLPMLLKSMIASYPDVMSKWKEEDFYSEKALEIKAQIDAALNDKRHTANEINAIFFDHFNKYGEQYVLLSDFLSAQALNLESPMMRDLFICFERNELTKGWTPKHPIKIYHSKEDNVVPYQNAEAVKTAFGSSATLQFAPENSTHTQSCAMWMLLVLMGGI